MFEIMIVILCLTALLGALAYAAHRENAAIGPHGSTLPHQRHG